MPDITPTPTEEEAGAIAAVLRLVLVREPAAEADRMSRWARAGRLEALGLPASGAGLRAGWRR